MRHTDHVIKLTEDGIEWDTQGVPKSWRTYWEVPAISTQQREHQVQSRYYLRKLEAAISLSPEMRVLDFGCGFGFVAEGLSEKVSEVLLWDASSNMRSQAQHLNAARANVRLIDLSTEKALAQSLSLDLILVNSVIQYMGSEEFSTWLTCWRNMLASNGRIVLSDLIPLASPPRLLEMYEAFVFNVRHGLLGHLLSRTNFSAIKRYSKTSQTAEPLLKFSKESLAQFTHSAGLALEVLPNNLTHFSSRLTAVLTREKENC